jgi:uncharacterized protein (DUF1501 family)
MLRKTYPGATPSPLNGLHGERARGEGPATPVARRAKAGEKGPDGLFCPGPRPRREFLRLGLHGLAATLSLPALLQLRARAATNPAARRTAVILVWCRGGLSHLDTYDPKPDVGSEFRGPFQPIPSAVPGLHVSELLPRHARIARRFTLVRSLSHTGGGHPAGSLQMLTGDPDPQDKPRPVYPDWMTVANLLREDRGRALPNYVGVNGITHYDNFEIAGSAYVNPAYGPFLVNGDPNQPQFEVPNVGLKDAASADRLQGRVDLRRALDRLERAVDRSGTMAAIDEFEAQALRLLTSPAARNAFDLRQESEAVRDRYGRHRWGQQCLLARRLVEAGVEIVTTTLDGPLCGRVANWDDHAVNHHIFEALQFRAPPFDQAVSALIEDIYERGLDQRTLVVVSGEFGRTPRIEHTASSGGGVASAPAGVTQPGRDHWPRAFSQLWAGGGIETGKILGATDRRGEDVTERLITPGDFLATLYRHLGIDFEKVAIPNFAGRPVPIVAEGRPVPELLGRA